jgi:hypothetical protein
MSNRVTLEQLLEMDSEAFNALPADQIEMLFEDVATLKARAKQLDDRLYYLLDKRFSGQAATLRQADGKDTGTVRIPLGNLVVLADLPKKVEWDEEGLVNVEFNLLAQGEPVDEYIKVRRTVAENAYTNWPTSLQAMFAPYRTVGTGKATYKLEAAKKSRRDA